MFFKIRKSIFKSKYSHFQFLEIAIEMGNTNGRRQCEELEREALGLSENDESDSSLSIDREPKTPTFWRKKRSNSTTLFNSKCSKKRKNSLDCRITNSDFFSQTKGVLIPSPTSSCSLEESPKNKHSESPIRIDKELDNSFNFLEQIGNWTNSKTFSLIYYNRQEEFSSRELNNKICGKSNLCFLITTESNKVFGCYCADIVPLPQYINTKLTNQKTFFLFSLSHIYSTRLFPKTQNSIIIHPNNEKSFVFSVFSAFWILQDQTIHFHKHLKLHYSIPDEIFSPFSSFNFKLKIKSFVVLQCEV
ncbi:hypothetical protein EIN_117990 [Entamoeba invadens IP1]|uniref:TLDc domain-containing protein n=1 Tax=Entamoeba invadens IP1 TaxID=370355 RepID=L7FPV6_ENTIV|nr:hypothetical protein EIN_117990 [Entamoeba invadens IP1]ELP92225.1 hypothetical protein EIN_117990 [Entamoeba invadens IP1]|eukprot:XP_004258996.1 hypothetical protein EIN_117990 [Entamoeba invadens IP1]